MTVGGYNWCPHCGQVSHSPAGHESCALAAKAQSAELELGAAGYDEVNFMSPVPIRPAFFLEALDGSLRDVTLGSVSIGNTEQLAQSAPADAFGSPDVKSTLILDSMEPGIALRLCFGNAGAAVRFRVWFGTSAELRAKALELAAAGLAEKGSRS